MSNEDPWAKMKAPPSGEFPADKWNFDKPGSVLDGTVTNIREATFPDGSTAPEMWLRDKAGTEWQVTCGPFGLQQQLFDLRPQVNDRVAIRYEGETKLGGGKAKKSFKVQVAHVQAAAPAPAPAPAAAPAPPPPPPAPVAAPAMDNDLFAGSTVQDNTPRDQPAMASDDLFA